MIKTIGSGLLVLGLLTIQVCEADAAACAAGPYRAGCVGPRGAVGVHRGYRLWLPWRRGCETCLQRALLLARRRAHLPLTLIWGASRLTETSGCGD